MYDDIELLTLPTDRAESARYQSNLKPSISPEKNVKSSEQSSTSPAYNNNTS